MPAITVAMITMNEEGAIGKVVADIRRVAPEAEILVVDSSKAAIAIRPERFRNIEGPSRSVCWQSATLRPVCRSVE